MVKKKMRALALELLLRIEKGGSFSHLLLSEVIRKEKLSEQDERLLTEIVYGTIERKLTLDYSLKPYIRSKKKIADWVRMLLRMSVFQLEHLDKVPDYAVIHEAVEIAKQKGHRGIASFVNGVLRNYLRKGPPQTAKISDEIERLALETSHPDWLVRRWAEQYGFEKTKKMCETNLTRKPISLRVNEMRATREDIVRTLEDAEVIAKASPYVSGGLVVERGNVLKTSLVRDGLVTIQDQSSMLASKLVDAKPQMEVLDACSAPGGKATAIGEMMKNEGRIYAHDLHENKIKAIEKNRKRLGLSNIYPRQADARELQCFYKHESFDRILVDAPCSGLGVIRSKPDIKYNKRPEDIEKLKEIQFDILNEVAPLLKKDGKIVYSTCTVDKTENEGVVERFLKVHLDFTVDETLYDDINDLPEDARVTKFGIQLFPQTIQSDGFFMTRLMKSNG